MMFIGILFSIAAIGVLCWLLFTLAVFALPVFAGATAGAWAYQTGAGWPGSIIIGLVAAALTLGIGQFLLAFVGSVLMWWIYFDTGAQRGAEHIEHHAEAGKVARAAYTYLHMPIVAGIVVSAVADALLAQLIFVSNRAEDDKRALARRLWHTLTIAWRAALAPGEGAGAGLQ